MLPAVANFLAALNLNAAVRRFHGGFDRYHRDETH